MIKGVVTYYLNKRVGKPSLKADKAGYFLPGEEVEVVDVVVGEEPSDYYNGEPIWYKLSNGIYAWSGEISISSNDILYQKKKVLEDLVKDKNLNESIKCFHTIDDLTQNSSEYKKLMKEYNFKHALPAMKEVLGNPTQIPSIQFVVDSKINNPLGKEIPKLIKYKDQYIPTDVVEEDTISFNSTICQPGDYINRRGFNGTLGFKVYRDVSGVRRYYGLTCFHVAFANELRSGVKKITKASNVLNPSVFLKSPITNIGTATEGVFRNDTDAALIEIKEREMNTHVKKFYGNPTQPLRNIRNRDLLKSPAALLYGGVSGEKNSKINALCPRPIVVESQWGEYSFQNVIRTKCFSKSGDSGAPVFDENGRPIGILFASSKQYSYIIRAEKIELNLKIKFSHV